MFGSRKEKQLKEKLTTNLESMEFVFKNWNLGTIQVGKNSFEVQGTTFDGRSLAIHMYNSSEDSLKEIRLNMKIVDGDKLKSMDDLTFNALIKYGNELCTAPKLARR